MLKIRNHPNPRTFAAGPLVDSDKGLAAAAAIGAWALCTTLATATAIATAIATGAG